MRFNTLFFLVFISCLCLALTQVPYEDCCLKYVRKMSHRAQKHAVSYRWQVPDGGCNIKAVIVTMRKGMVLCTDPRQRWVVELMKKIDKKDKPHHPRRPYRG